MLSHIVRCAVFVIIHARMIGAIQTPEPQCSNNPAGPLSAIPRHTICMPLVDDDIARKFKIWSPWSYPPVCVRSRDRSETSKLCTYSIPSLRGGRGMSIITKPNIASGLASVLQDPDIAWLGKERGSPLVPDLDGAFEVREIPGKGAGVIATRPIAEGQVVMMELPLIVRIGDPSPWNRPEALQVVQQAARGLLKQDQDRLIQMARQGKGYILDDIFKTNAFHVSVEGIAHTALYPEIAVRIRPSRVNGTNY